jgi:hypothetical protein
MKKRAIEKRTTTKRAKSTPKPAAKRVKRAKRPVKRPVERAKRPAPQYVIVRCRDAGVHAGEYVGHVGREVVLENSRRIWYWSGAASLSEIAVHGCAKPAECKIAMAVPKITLTEACEIIVCLPAGEKFLREVAVWKA